MHYRSFSITAIVLIFFATAVFIFSYGPSTRTFVMPGKTVAVRTSQELDNIWHTAGIHGRIAVLFTRHMNQEFSNNYFPQTDYIDSAFNHGIVRKVYYIVPDRYWADVAFENSQNRAVVTPLKITDTGFILLHDEGRIQVMPLSKYIPEQEKSLVVIEEGVWDQQEMARINRLIKSRQLETDLLAMVGN